MLEPDARAGIQGRAGGHGCTGALLEDWRLRHAIRYFREQGGLITYNLVDSQIANPVACLTIQNIGL